MDLDENKYILAVHLHHTLKTYPCCNLHNTQEVRTWHATQCHANRDAYTHKNKHAHTDRCTNRQTLYASLRVTQRKEEEEKRRRKKWEGLS